MFYLYTLKSWRKDVVFEQAPLMILVDIGAGELDDAVNETTAYIAQKGRCVSEYCYFGKFHNERDKAQALASFSRLEAKDDIYIRRFEDFNILDDMPICYWTSNKFMENLRNLEPFGTEIADVQMGLAPRDEFRYSRLWWEVDSSGVGADRKWVGYAKGGELSPYFSDVELLLNAKEEMREIKADLNKKYPYLKGNTDWVLHPENDYFSPGLTFGQRTTFLRVSVLPKGCYFSVAGKAIFGKAISNEALLQAINTPSAQYLMYIRRELLEINPQFQEGDVARMPWPKLDENTLEQLAKLGVQNSRLVADVFSFDETSHGFQGLVDPRAYMAVTEKAKIGIEESESEADALLSSSIGLTETDHMFIEQEILPRWNGRSVANWYKYKEGLDEVTFAFGVIFGRWDFSVASGLVKSKVNYDAFDSLPVASPGMLQNADSSLLTIAAAPEGSPIDIAVQGIVVEDQSDGRDIVRGIRSVFDFLWKERAEVIETKIFDHSRCKDIREYIGRPSGFFMEHLSRYSKNGRKAPIYWPLATASGSYTLWLYYPALNSQTLYTAVNDFVEPKLKSVAQTAQGLRGVSGRSKAEEKELEQLQDLEAELGELRDTLLEIARDYHPHHDDGVQITAAPLWPLFRHKPWQKVLKDTWAKLEKGDYDWAHLAMHYWPERVREKCRSDKSLAIAHGLEDLYQEPPAKPKKGGRGRVKT